jgi:hypothetical protein
MSEQLNFDVPGGVGLGTELSLRALAFAKSRDFSVSEQMAQSQVLFSDRMRAPNMETFTLLRIREFVATPNGRNGFARSIRHSRGAERVQTGNGKSWTALTAPTHCS